MEEEFDIDDLPDDDDFLTLDEIGDTINLLELGAGGDIEENNHTRLADIGFFRIDELNVLPSDDSYNLLQTLCTANYFYNDKPFCVDLVLPYGADSLPRKYVNNTSVEIEGMRVTLTGTGTHYCHGVIDDVGPHDMVIFRAHYGTGKQLFMYTSSNECIELYDGELKMGWYRYKDLSWLRDPDSQKNNLKPVVVENVPVLHTNFPKSSSYLINYDGVYHYVTPMQAAALRVIDRKCVDPNGTEYGETLVEDGNYLFEFKTKQIIEKVNYADSQERVNCTLNSVVSTEFLTILGVNSYCRVNHTYDLRLRVDREATKYDSVLDVSLISNLFVNEQREVIKPSLRSTVASFLIDRPMRLYSVYLKIAERAYVNDVIFHRGVMKSVVPKYRRKLKVAQEKKRKKSSSICVTRLARYLPGAPRRSRIKYTLLDDQLILRLASAGFDFFGYQIELPLGVLENFVLHYKRKEMLVVLRQAYEFKRKIRFADLFGFRIIGIVGEKVNPLPKITYMITEPEPEDTHVD
jgi:hypothetical protein